MILKPLGTEIPAGMGDWVGRIDWSRPTEDFEGNKMGKYVVVDIQKSPIEQHHMVRVIDENERELTGVRVIFGFPGGGGKEIPIGTDKTYWSPTEGAPAVLDGNAQYTRSGFAQHTTGEKGGEDIWIHNIERSGIIEYSSDLVRDCKWVADPSMNLHTGVQVTFQLQRHGFVTDEERLANLEQRVQELEEKLRNG